MLVYCKLQHLACTKTLAQRPQRPQLLPWQGNPPSYMHCCHQQLSGKANMHGSCSWQHKRPYAVTHHDGMCTHTISHCDVLAQPTFRSWYALPALIDSLLGV